MSWLINTTLTGIAVATATTFDDNIYLTLFFGKVNRFFRPQHIVVGEYIGFTVLVGLSLVGFLGGLIIPPMWIGLLGILPMLIGISHLINRENEDDVQEVSPHHNINKKLSRGRRQSLWSILQDPQTYRVSAVTIANGGNNIGIYIPLFASSSFSRLSLILSICYLMIGLWCFLSYHLTRQPHLALIMARYGRKVFPFVLIWIGWSIIMENQSYQILASLAPFSR